MRLRITGRVIGKTKKAMSAETNNKGFTTYSVPVLISSPYYNKNTKKTTFELDTVWVNMTGNMSEPRLAIFNKEGVEIVIEGELEKAVAIKDGKPMIHNNEGPRKGDFMYNYTLRARTNDIDLTAKTGGDNSGTTALAKDNKSSFDTSDNSFSI